MHIYRYVTESTFDSYLWQTVEAKQKFISQVMTSRTPLRSCEDVDETALGRMTYESDTDGYLYCGNLPEALAGTPWQYCPIVPFYRHDEIGRASCRERVSWYV